MNLDRLRIFLEVAELGSMHAAARAVHLTQPAVSRNVKLLEAELGATLFVREGRGLVLSGAGRALVPRARELLELADRTAHAVRRTADRDYFDLRLGSVDSVATFLLPEVLSALQDGYPDLVVRLNTGRTARLLERVRGDVLDLAVCAYSGPPPDVRATPVGAYTLTYYGRRDRFADLADVDDEEGLSAFPIVEIEPPPEARGLEPAASSSHARASNVATVKAMILAGFGVGDLVPFMLSANERASLVAGQIPHDPNCHLYVAGAPGWGGPGQSRIETDLCELLRARLSGGASEPARST